MRNADFLNWLLFMILSVIWGSSFILMKEGLLFLSPYQVASIRIISAGAILLPVAIKNLKKISSKKLFFIFLSGMLGSFLPAYLFCIAEQAIDSSLAGVLNALTPVFVIITGALFFKSRTTATKIAGIFIAFAGSVLLFLNQPGFAAQSNVLYVLLVVLATLLYGLNVNMVHRHLAAIPSLHIAAVALALNAIPALLVLYITGYFQMNFTNGGALGSTLFSCILGIGGTAFATILFYMLLKKAGALFASMVTYAIPVIAIMWGIIYGEKLGWKQAVCMAIILAGVWIVNKKPAGKKNEL